MNARGHADAREAFFAARPGGDGTLAATIGSLSLKNPVMPASGCFGPELGRLIPACELGAAVTKTVFRDPRSGNPPHRVTEVPAGMINSVGIPSQGPAGFLGTLYGQYQELGVPVIISVGAHRPAGYAATIRELAGAGDAYELNVSCPNLDRDGMEIGTDPAAIAAAVAGARRATGLPLIVKLSPMVTSIADCATAAQDAGADAVCVCNSIPVLPLDRRTRAPVLGNTIGGLSGPAIKPIVLRLVWLTARAVQIPVIACGGIETAADALEYMSLGAAAVQIGTASFARPFAAVEIARDLFRQRAGTPRRADAANRADAADPSGAGTREAL